jgi:Fur family transcriptional regulator, ferric uptake regulator
MAHYQSDIAEIVAKFEAQGLRWTVQRQLVLQIVQQHSGHLTVDDIYQVVAKTYPSINRSTVYRTLETLSEMGVIIEMQGEGNLHRYEMVHPHPHYHAVCEKCGGEIEVEEAVIQKLQAEVWRDYHLRLKLDHFVGMGICQPCYQQYAHSLN